MKWCKALKAESFCKWSRWCPANPPNQIYPPIRKNVSPWEECQCREPLWVSAWAVWPTPSLSLWEEPTTSPASLSNSLKQQFLFLKCVAGVDDWSRTLSISGMLLSPLALSTMISSLVGFLIRVLMNSFLRISSSLSLNRGWSQTDLVKNVGWTKHQCFEKIIAKFIRSRLVSRLESWLEDYYFLGQITFHIINRG